MNHPARPHDFPCDYAHCMYCLNHRLNERHQDNAEFQRVYKYFTQFEDAVAFCQQDSEELKQIGVGDANWAMLKYHLFVVLTDDNGYPTEDQ